MSTEKALTNEQIRLLLHFQWLQEIKYDKAAEKINELYGEKTTSRSAANKWYKRFSEEGMQLKDKLRSGRPKEIDRDAILSAIEASPTLSTRMLGDDFECSNSTVFEILKEAGKRWRKTRWVPYNLTDAQKEKRVEISTKLLERQNSDPFLHNLLTMDETWVPYNNPNPKNQWLSPGQRASPTPMPDFRQRKIMISVFWCPTGIVHWEFADQTVTAKLYCKQLRRVSKKLKDRDEPIVFLHDNAPSHTAKMTKKKLKELEWDVLPHAPYSPDKAPSDFWLFRQLKMFLKGKMFKDQEEVRVALDDFFDSQSAEFYAKGINKLVERWTEIIGFDGDYCD